MKPGIIEVCRRRRDRLDYGRDASDFERCVVEVATKAGRVSEFHEYATVCMDGDHLPKIPLEIHLRLCASLRQIGKYTHNPGCILTLHRAESKTLRTFQFKVSKVWISPA